MVSSILLDGSLDLLGTFGRKLLPSATLGLRVVVKYQRDVAIPRHDIATDIRVNDSDCVRVKVTIRCKSLHTLGNAHCPRFRGDLLNGSSNVKDSSSIELDWCRLIGRIRLCKDCRSADHKNTYNHMS